jgi:8-oxo-dGTP pyrophosphatase MutT (NUDIX family)
MTRAPDKKRKSDGAEVRAQIAALPWRRDAESGIEVMLVSSRETKRWIIPKGWPIKGMKPHQAAAIEAMEEAGLEGKIEKEPVDVYPLKVSKQRKSWPEKGQRVTRWFTAEDAADNVFEEELAALIRRIALDDGS